MLSKPEESLLRASQWVETREAPPPPTMHRMAPSSENPAAPSVRRSFQAEGPWSHMLAFLFSDSFSAPGAHAPGLQKEAVSKTSNHQALQGCSWGESDGELFLCFCALPQSLLLAHYMEVFWTNYVSPKFIFHIGFPYRFFSE